MGYGNDYKERRGCSGKKVCCVLCTVLLVMILVLGLTCLILYFVLKPKLPSYNVTSVDLQSFNTVQGKNATGAGTMLINMYFVMSVHAKNPNKVAIEIDDSKVDIVFQGLQSGQATAPGFEQPKESDITVQLPVNATNIDVQSQSAALVADIANGTVPFVSVAHIGGAIKIWKITSPTFSGDLTCNMNLLVASKKITVGSCTPSFGW